MEVVYIKKEMIRDICGLFCIFHGDGQKEGQYHANETHEGIFFTLNNMYAHAHTCENVKISQFTVM